MEPIGKEAGAETTRKYIALLSTINEMEKRLGWTDIVLLVINILLVLFAASYISKLFHQAYNTFLNIDFLLIFFCLAIGMSACTYWVAMTIRLQLKLKLRYFQARFLERKMNAVGENIISDEAPFFASSIRNLESPDKKEHLYYPTMGIAGMDGFIGSAKQRHFSWFLPIVCFAVHIYIFVWTILFSLSM